MQVPRVFEVHEPTTVTKSAKRRLKRVAPKDKTRATGAPATRGTQPRRTESSKARRRIPKSSAIVLQSTSGEDLVQTDKDIATMVQRLMIEIPPSQLRELGAREVKNMGFTQTGVPCSRFPAEVRMKWPITWQSA